MTPFSIIIPTYQEADNLPQLVNKIAAVDFSGREFEVLLIDDNSQDGIIDVAAELSKQYPWLKLIVRQGKRDLAQSILLGFQEARFPILVTMDADLSHPPAAIPRMLDVLEQHQAEMVIGSRYITGGSSDEKWPWYRYLISLFAAMLARPVLPVLIKDPLSGFLVFRRSILKPTDSLSPLGWKIGLEMIVKCHCQHIIEYPIHFSQRQLGTSKLTLSISLDYCRHIVKLLRFVYVNRSP